MFEPRRVRRAFTYVWDQDGFDPITHDILNHIHFEFKNGKRWKRAFTYEWRLYTPAEVRDALLFAGFTNAQIFWDLEEDEDSSDYRPVVRAMNTPGWIAYIVAEDEGNQNGNGKGNLGI